MAMEKPIRVFCSYARKDMRYLQELRMHLQGLQRQGIISLWTDTDISPGTVWEEEIAKQLFSAQIILLLVSPDFLASEYVFSKEMSIALERHQLGEARVIPVILRPVLWKDAPFGKLQALPRDGKPVTDRSRGSLDEAFFEIAEGIRLACEELQVKHENKSVTPITPDKQPIHIYHLDQVFVKSGFPHLTFVEREDFGLLKLALALPGRGVIIEGPSGVGKTTALKKALEEVQVRKKVSKTVELIQLSARDPDHRERLTTLPKWHRGTVIIDDFHRLDLSLSKNIVDYLKYLADTEPESKKLVIVGIPQSGQMLVDIAFDVATRIDVFKWGKVKDELVFQMIEKGERVLNIEFDRRTDVVLAASGSLNVAQFLCLYICLKEQVDETQDQRRIVHCDVNAAISNVTTDLARKFSEPMRRFVAMGGHRDITCLRLLEELALSDEGFLFLPHLKDRKRELAHGIERFINERWMAKLYNEYPSCMNHLFFDQMTYALIAEDPQLAFYLKQMQFATMAKAAGKIISHARRKVFVSYSHKDTEWLERLQVHLKPLEREGILDIWADTKIIAGMQWREEIQNAIESSTVAIVLVSADFLASDFIEEHELPKILSRAKTGGTTILPVIVSPCLFVGSGIDVFQSINSPDLPLVEMAPAERERTLVKLAQIISQKLTEEGS